MSVPSQKSSRDEQRIAKTPSRRRGRERVAALLDAGADVFAEEGYDAATMTAIAARAGASIGSLYQFFPTKEHLAAAIHARHLDALADVLDDLLRDCEGGPVAVMADRLFARLTAYLGANPAFIVLGERRTMDPAVKKQARLRLRRQIEALLGAANPPVPRKRHAALAAVILYMLRMAAMLRADDDPAIRDDAVMELKAMLAGHLALSGG